LEAISQYDLEQSGSEDEHTRSLRARLMLLRGDLEGAGAWVDSFTNPPPDMAFVWLEEPQLTRARILLARGSDADLQSARQVLDTLEEITRRTHNTAHELEVQVLRALMLDARGENGAADSVLEQAEMARVVYSGFRRPGKPMRLCCPAEAGHAGSGRSHPGGIPRGNGAARHRTALRGASHR
jgi:hypothetical protein